jgi:hypothetical protein
MPLSRGVACLLRRVAAHLRRRRVLRLVALRAVRDGRPLRYRRLIALALLRARRRSAQLRAEFMPRDQTPLVVLDPYALDDTRFLNVFRLKKEQMREVLTLMEIPENWLLQCGAALVKLRTTGVFAYSLITYRARHAWEETEKLFGRKRSTLRGIYHAALEWYESTLVVACHVARARFSFRARAATPPTHFSPRTSF